MELYSIGIATDCSLDYDFFAIMEQAARVMGLSTYMVRPHNLAETISRIRDKELNFLAFYDRASDTSPAFLDLYSVLADNQVLYFVNLDLQKTASDKSIMHKQFITNEINVPKTLIIPALNRQPKLKLVEQDLEMLSRPFVLKPAVNTGSGIGVHLDANTLTDVEEKRQEFPDDDYLLQQKIIPKEYDAKRFWFRVFYVCGSIIGNWWDNNSHRYQPIADEDELSDDIKRFNIILKRMHDICGLQFFSTELAITEDNSIYAIDYVNEICDMRLQSKYYDGIPDDVVKNIAEKIVEYLERHLNIPSTPGFSEFKTK